MVVSCTVVAQHGLVFFRYSGLIRAGETAKAQSELAANPAYHAGLRQFSDMSDVTGMQLNPEKIGVAMERSAEEFEQASPELPVVFAPSDISQSVARMVQQIWLNRTGQTPLVATRRDELPDMLGLPESVVTDLLKCDPMRSQAASAPESGRCSPPKRLRALWRRFF